MSDHVEVGNKFNDAAKMIGGVEDQSQYMVKCINEQEEWDDFVTFAASAHVDAQRISDAIRAKLIGFGDGVQEWFVIIRYTNAWTVVNVIKVEVDCSGILRRIASGEEKVRVFLHSNVPF